MNARMAIITPMATSLPMGALLCRTHRQPPLTVSHITITRPTLLPIMKTETSIRWIHAARIKYTAITSRRIHLRLNHFAGVEPTLVPNTHSCPLNNSSKARSRRSGSTRNIQTTLSVNYFGASTNLAISCSASLFVASRRPRVQYELISW